MPLARSFGAVVVPALLGAAVFGGSPRVAAACPTQSIASLQAVCADPEYGARVRFCYAPVNNWYFKEHVVNSGTDACQGGDIDMTLSPFMSTTGCIVDSVVNENGPAANVAPCDDTTLQKVFTGPTLLQVNDCEFDNTQLIRVTTSTGSPPSAVKTTITPTSPVGAAQSVACAY